MLLSHRKQFIFTKTVKTAGTSVESYFEQFCMRDSEWQESHERDQYVSEAGIIGYRGADGSGSTWYNHMPAKRIRALVGHDIWHRYFKFTVVRNPFDKLISGFCQFERRKQTYSRKRKLRALAKLVLDKGDPIDRVRGVTDVERFRCWIRKGGAFIDRDKYMIDREECVDYFIRFEDLPSEIRHVCDRLSVPFEPSRIPGFKRGMRAHSRCVRDYYDRDTEEIVRRLYAWELKRFGYDLPR